MKITRHILLACLFALSAAAKSDEIDGIPVSNDAISITEFCMASWPRDSVANREEGVVGLMVLVDIDGTAADAKVIETSGFRSLDKASTATARLCKYAPAKKDNLPVKAWFKLQHYWTAGAPASPITNHPACVPPPWPREALLNNHQGAVKLQFLVDTNGEIKDYGILKSSGYAHLDKAAAEGIAKCWFRPKNENGRPIKSWQTMEYHWTLE
ncbi:energy transducer TonB [Pseudoduganella sp.]|uniref:energy transducer TonB n=1 Tax=Pseudoduganella sp. TaxID=1880898 RepID=UPI0035B4A7FB